MVISVPTRTDPLTESELEGLLVEVIRRLVGAFDGLEEVWLYGSYGPRFEREAGRAGKWTAPSRRSDLDLMVVVKGVHPVDRHRVAYQALRGIPVDQSIRVYPRSDWEARVRLPGLENAVRDRGRRIYPA